jgi:hypothetical protein
MSRRARNADRHLTRGGRHSHSAVHTHPDPSSEPLTTLDVRRGDPVFANGIGGFTADTQARDRRPASALRRWVNVIANP